LAHEPDWRKGSRLAAGCAEQRRIVEGHTEEGTYRRQRNASGLTQDRHQHSSSDAIGRVVKLRPKP
jgi:hypothetical protein